jgi:hypothetical protein
LPASHLHTLPSCAVWVPLMASFGCEIRRGLLTPQGDWVLSTPGLIRKNQEFMLPCCCNRKNRKCSQLVIYLVFKVLETDRSKKKIWRCFS